MKDTAYLTASAYIRAREKTLFTRERAERMMEARSFEEAAKVLSECGYDIPDEKTVEQSLAAARRDTFALLTELTPDPVIVDFFRVGYDYHNLKVLIKTERLPEGRDDLLLSCGRVESRLLADAVRNLRFSELPGDMEAAALEAREMLARTGDPQLSDMALDRAHMGELVRLARESGSAFLTGYAALLVDAANLRAAVRALRLGRGPDFLRHVLCPGGRAEAYRLTAAAAGGAFAELYAHTKLERAAELAGSAARGDGSLTAFERAADDAVMAYLKQARLSAFGEQPLIAYLAAREAESKAIRTVLSGRRAGVPPEAIRERLREFY